MHETPDDLLRAFLGLLGPRGPIVWEIDDGHRMSYVMLSDNDARLLRALRIDPR